VHHVQLLVVHGLLLAVADLLGDRTLTATLNLGLGFAQRAPTLVLLVFCERLLAHENVVADCFEALHVLEVFPFAGLQFSHGVLVDSNQFGQSLLNECLSDVHLLLRGLFRLEFILGESGCSLGGRFGVELF